MKLKAAEEANIDCELVHLSEDLTEGELLYKIYEYNNDPAVHGILVQLPLPKHISEHTITSAVADEKDVDGFGIQSIGELAKRGGKPVLDDPVMRDKLVEYMIEIQALNLNNQRRRMAPLTSDRPMGLALMNKLARTELVRELTEFSLQFQGTRAGYYVGDENAVDDGYWHRSYLNSFSATIGGGTSQIQKNIIGEHVLGLPKGR